MKVNPVVFKLDPDDKKYMIDDGRRRLSVVRYDLGWDEVTVDIEDDTDGILSSLIYNFQRDANPMMEALHIHELLGERGYTQKDLAHELGCTQSKISKRLRLLELTDGLQHKLEKGEIAKSVGYHLSKLPVDKQTDIEQMLDDGKTVSLKDIKEVNRRVVVDSLDMERIEETPEIPTGEEERVHGADTPAGAEIYADIYFTPEGDGGIKTRIEYEGDLRAYNLLKEYLKFNGELEIKLEEVYDERE